MRACPVCDEDLDEHSRAGALACLADVGWDLDLDVLLEVARPRPVERVDGPTYRRVLT